MANKITTKLTVSSNDKVIASILVSCDSISALLSHATDSEENASLFEALAEHPSADVREQIAYKDSINENTVHILLKDNSINVLRNLVRNRAFRVYASDEQVSNLVERDAEIAISIASSYDDFENVDHDALVELLIEHSDPRVVAEVAGNWNTKKKVLKKLLKHEEVKVASEAKRRLDDE